jgi:hypothetical protein
MTDVGLVEVKISRCKRQKSYIGLEKWRTGQLEGA